MTKPNLSKVVKSIRTTLTRHSPEILTGIGIAGMVTTTVLAVKATPKALKSIDEAKRVERKDKLTPVETVKVTWKHYIPAAAIGATSIACLIGASSVSLRRNAALATAYKLSETALTEYREKVVETIGEKKEQVVRDKVAKEQIEKKPVSKNEVVVTGTGDSRFFDPMSGRHFYSSVEKVKKAENELNRRMIHDVFGYASLNEFYDEIGLPRTEVGEIIGWRTDNLVDMGISAQVDDDDKPSIVLDYRVRPDYGYDK